MAAPPPPSATTDEPTPAADPARWDPALDAVAAAAAHHRVLFENDRVRVLEVSLGPGQVEPPHHHRWPGVLCILEGEHLVDHEAVGGTVVLDTREGLGPLPALATIWKDPESLHFVANPTDSDIRMLRIELKS